MKRRFGMVANSLVAVGLLALTSSAAAFASAVPAAEGAGLPAEWYFDYGARYAEKALRALPSESFYTGPANQPRLARTADAPAVAYVSRSEGGRLQMEWILPAPQSCSRVVSAPFRWGIEGD